MRKIQMLAAGILVLLFALTGCSSSGEPEFDRTELTYTIEETRNLPEELQKIIDENKKEEMRMSYEDGTVLYLIRGYGEQPTGGYSIVIKECSEDEQSILLDTLLIGPQNKEEMKKEPSWPYIVLKTENKKDGKGEREILIN